MAIVKDAQDKVPPPTAITLLSPDPVPEFIVTEPETVKLLEPLIERVRALPPELIVKVAQTAATFTVGLSFPPTALSGMTTSCAAVGTKFSDQFEAVPQSALVFPVHVFVCPQSSALKKSKLSIGSVVRLKRVYGKDRPAANNTFEKIEAYNGVFIINNFFWLSSKMVEGRKQKTAPRHKQAGERFGYENEKWKFTKNSPARPQTIEGRSSRRRENNAAKNKKAYTLK